jgi:hypothetical protein
MELESSSPYPQVPAICPVDEFYTHINNYHIYLTPQTSEQSAQRVFDIRHLAFSLQSV